MVIRKNDDIMVIELTVCFETNVEKSRNYKMNKYRSLRSDLDINVKSYDLILIEITTLGFYMQSKVLKRLFKKHDINAERCFEMIHPKES